MSSRGSSADSYYCSDYDSDFEEDFSSDSEDEAPTTTSTSANEPQVATCEYIPSRATLMLGGVIHPRKSKHDLKRYRADLESRQVSAANRRLTLEWRAKHGPAWSWSGMLKIERRAMKEVAALHPKGSTAKELAKMDNKRRARRQQRQGFKPMTDPKPRKTVSKTSTASSSKGKLSAPRTKVEMGESGPSKEEPQKKKVKREQSEELELCLLG